MLARLPDPRTLTQLTPAEKRVAEVLVTGASNAQGAAALGLSIHTFTAYVGNIGRKCQVTGRSARAARAHAVLASGQVDPPPTPARIPDFTPDERLLIQSVALHPRTEDIGRMAGIAPADVRDRVTALVDKAGADNEVHLVGLSHAWGILRATRGNTGAGGTQPGAGR